MTTGVDIVYNPTVGISFDWREQISEEALRPLRRASAQVQTMRSEQPQYSQEVLEILSNIDDLTVSKRVSLLNEGIARPYETAVQLGTVLGVA